MKRRQDEIFQLIEKDGHETALGASRIVVPGQRHGFGDQVAQKRWDGNDPTFGRQPGHRDRIEINRPHQDRLQGTDFVFDAGRHPQSMPRRHYPVTGPGGLAHQSGLRVHELNSGVVVGCDVVAGRVIECQRDHRALIRIDGAAFRWGEATLSELWHSLANYRETEYEETLFIHSSSSGMCPEAIKSPPVSEECPPCPEMFCVSRS